MRRASFVLPAIVFLVSGCAATQRSPATPKKATEKVATEGQEVAIAPMRDGSIVAAWIGEEDAIEVARSRDGNRFDDVVSLRVDGRSVCDPAIAVRDDGTIEVAWLAKNDEKWDEVLFASAATPKELPAHVSIVAAPKKDISLDKPAITITRAGTTLVSLLEMDANGRKNVLIARRATDGTFTTTTINDYPSAFDPTVCAAPDDARVWAVYLDANEVVARLSDDDARTWSLSESPLLIDNENPFLVSRLVTPPSCVARGKEVWVVEGVELVAIQTPFEDGTHGADMLVVGHGSPEEGFCGEAIASGHRFLDPTIVGEDDGAIDIVSYDGRVDDDPDGALRWWRWTSKGTKSFVLAAIRYHEGRGDDAWLGDYVGAAIVRHSLVVAYADNSFGHSFIDLRRVRLPKS